MTKHKITDASQHDIVTTEKTSTNKEQPMAKRYRFAMIVILCSCILICMENQNKTNQHNILPTDKKTSKNKGQTQNTRCKFQIVRRFQLLAPLVRLLVRFWAALVQSNSLPLRRLGITGPTLSLPCPTLDLPQMKMLQNTKTNQN